MGTIDDEVNNFLRNQLREALAQCWASQQELFARIFGGDADSVPDNKLKTALDLCRRTLKKNETRVES